VDIPGYLREIVIGIDHEGLISALVEMACPFMPFVKERCIGDIEVAHKLLEIGQRGLYDKVEMIAHEDKGYNVYLIDLF
jgi:hypothetical protein